MLSEKDLENSVSFGYSTGNLLGTTQGSASCQKFLPKENKSKGIQEGRKDKGVDQGFPHHFWFSINQPPRLTSLWASALCSPLGLLLTTPSTEKLSSLFSQFPSFIIQCMLRWQSYGLPLLWMFYYIPGWKRGRSPPTPTQEVSHTILLTDFPGGLCCLLLLNVMT